MPTPFIAFTAPDPGASWEAEPLALGLGIGALVGAIFPGLALGAEWMVGTTLSAALTSPSPAFFVSLLVPCLLAPVFAWGTHVLSAHRAAYDQVAHKAGSLMDESWELQTALEGLLDEPPTETVNVQSVPQIASLPQAAGAQHTPKPVVVSVERSSKEAADDAALIAAQTRLLDRFADASHDVAQRMQVNVRGLGSTQLNLVQRRLLDSLATHLHAFDGLSQEVRRYARNEPAPAPQPDRRSPRARQRVAA